MKIVSLVFLFFIISWCSSNEQAQILQTRMEKSQSNINQQVSSGEKKQVVPIDEYDQLIEGLLGGIFGLGIISIIIIKCRNYLQNTEIKKIIKLKFIEQKNQSNELILQVAVAKLKHNQWKMHYSQDGKDMELHIICNKISVKNHNDRIKKPYIQFMIDTNDKCKLEGFIKFTEMKFYVLMFSSCNPSQKTIQKKFKMKFQRNQLFVYEGNTQEIEEGFEGKCYSQDRSQFGIWRWKQNQLNELNNL